MVPSSADIVLQNRRISQSETSTINICDVVNTMARAAAEIKMYVLFIVRLSRHLDISQRTNHDMRDVMPTNYFFRRITKSTNQASCQADGL